MRAARFLLLSLPFVSNPALAGTANGSGALAVAALVGEVAPTLGAAEKDALMQLLDGKTGFSFPAGKTIPVAAGKSPVGPAMWTSRRTLATSPLAVRLSL